MFRLHVRHVSRRLPLEHVRAEELSKRMNMVVKRRARGRRGILSPELVDQLVLRHRPVGTQKEKPEEGALLRCRERDKLAVPTDLERPQDAELERSHLVMTLAPPRTFLYRLPTRH